MLLAGAFVALPAGGQAPESPLAPINALREDDELPPLRASLELDTVAAGYLASMMETRCLCPAHAGDAGAVLLLANVRSAIDADAPVVDAGLVVGYDRTPSAALANAALDPVNGAAIRGTRLRLAGIAAAVVDAGSNWLVPPPGRRGPEIDLGGYTIVVIVTAGPAE